MVKGATLDLMHSGVWGVEEAREAVKVCSSHWVW